MTFFFSCFFEPVSRAAHRWAASAKLRSGGLHVNKQGDANKLLKFSTSSVAFEARDVVVQQDRRP
jgi:hypothetical protein